MKAPLFKLALVLGLLNAPASLCAQRLPTPPSAPAVPAQPPAALAPPGSSNAQASFSVDADRQPVISLDGLWHFQQGDDPQWADPHLDDSHWALVQSDQDWSQNGYGNLSGTAWYRFRVTVPAGEEAYSLRLPKIYTCYQVFVDGKLLLTEGKLPPNPALYRSRPVLVDVSADARPTAKTILIALRVWHDPEWTRFQHGGLQGSATLGRSDIMHSRFDTEEQSHLWQYSDEMDLAALNLLAFVISLALFLSRRSEREFLWFSLMVLGSAGVHFFSAWGYLHVSPINTTDILSGLFRAMFLAASLLFLRTLLDSKWTHFFTFVLVCCGLEYVCEWMFPMGLLPAETVNFVLALFDAPIFLWIILLVRRRARERHPDARLLATPVTLYFASIFYMDLIWALRTLGLTSVSHLEIKWRHPFYLTLTDLTEGFFLLAMLVILLRRVSRTRREQDRIESELDAARSVQQVLVPESLPRVAGLAIGTSYQPAQEVGGDFFQILPLPSGDTLLVIGDVAGKGLPAALTVSLVVGTLRALAECTDCPAEILAGLNRSLQGRGPGFTTCLALRISAERDVLTFANAGHLSPYVNGFELRTEPNLPLGLIADLVFDEARYALNPGDHITVLTDGVPEAMNNRELFGFDRTVLMSREPAARIAEAARAFGQTDDITVLTIDVVSVPASYTEQMEPELQPA